MTRSDTSSITTSGPTPRAAGLSAILHFVVLIILLIAAWWTQRQPAKPEMIFEVVAGEGDNYAATEAPAPTVQTTVKLTLPDPPAVVIKPQPKPQPAPPQPKPKPIEVKREPTPVKIEKAIEKPPVKVEPAPERMSFNEFTKEEGVPQAKPVKQSAPAPVKAKSIDVGSLTSQVTVGAGGTALTASQQDLTALYKNMIRDRVIRSMQEAGITEPRGVDIQFSVSLDGLVSSPKIMRSSASSSFDRAVIDAFRSIGRIGRPPSNRAEVFRTVINLTEQ